jgi:hypothetical protein
MRYFSSVVIAAAVLASSAAQAQTPAEGRTLDLTFNDGRVTLIARGVTVPEIMSEWARKGGSKIVNAEKVIGGPVTYEFHDVPETVVLQSVLRSAAGYIAAPRRAGGPSGSSTIEQVMILAVSRPSANAVITMPTNQMPNPVIIQGSPDDDIPPVVTPAGAARPQVQPAQPDVPVATSPTPGVVIAPVKPGAPVPPGTIIKK